MFALNSYLAGILIGGVLISTLGSGSTYFLENKKPAAKSILRDFIIGAVLTTMVFQLLPETSTKAVASIGALLPMAGGFISAASDDVEVKVGVPKF